MKQGLLVNLGRALAVCLIVAHAASAQEAPAPKGDADASARKAFMDAGDRLQLPRL